MDRAPHDCVGISVDLIGRIVEIDREISGWMAHRKGITGHNYALIVFAGRNLGIQPIDFTLDHDFSRWVTIITHDPVSSMMRPTATKFLVTGVNRSNLRTRTHLAVPNQILWVTDNCISEADLRRLMSDVIYFQCDQTSVFLQIDHLNPFHRFLVHAQVGRVDAYRALSKELPDASAAVPHLEQFNLR